MVRIGLIGAGVIGATHSAVLQQISRELPGRVELAAVADPDPSRRELFQQLYGYSMAFASAEELFEHGEPSAIFICTPTRHHAAMVHAAAERGLDIFCEKPLAMSYREGERMVAAAERAGCKTQIGLVLRYSPVYTVMRSLLQVPGTGEPLATVFRDDQCFPIRGFHDSGWRADRTISAGGTLIEHGVHDLDILTWFFGPIARVRAWERNFAGHAGIEDYVAAEIEMASGLRAQLINIWHNVLRRHSNRRLEIFCQNTFIASEHDMHGEVIHQLGDREAETISADEVVARFVAEHHAADHPLRDWFGAAYLVQDLAFIEALTAGKQPSPSLREGLEAQRLAYAVYHAARTGEEVEVESFTPAKEDLDQTL
ncbi:MAG TPA: Gfo/Idh/MocA family oxidoreductase [Terriglobales bacterium]|nr:Gfo/Idh/MocA family oxidoreductase [Terriglobales bacterium]